MSPYTPPESSYKGRMNAIYKNTHHLEVTLLMGDVWIGFEYCVDRKDANNSNLFASTDL